MKKIILIICVISLTFSGCVDLDQHPQSFLTPETLVYDKATMESLTNGLYRDLWGGNYEFNCRSQILGLGADDIITGLMIRRHTMFDELQVTTTNKDQNDDVRCMWQNMYKLARAATTLIEYIPPSTIETEDVKKPYLGEAYFMRAFAYYQLVRYYGDIPIFFESTHGIDIYGNTGNSIVRAGVEAVYDEVIVPDLKKAIELLSDKSRSGDNSRVSRVAAMTCLSDVYLTMAGWPLKKTEYYAAARDTAYSIITKNTNNHRLIDNYSDLWLEETKSDNTEHIFALNMSSLYNMSSQYGKSYYAIEEATGSAWADYLADSCFYERFPNDTRKDFNFVTRFQISTDPVRYLDFKRSSMRSPAIAKYRDYGSVASAQSDGIMPIFRWAEVLLIYAEAQNEADGSPNALAYECLNTVRKRAVGGGTYDEATNMTKSEFAKAVFDERGWEFFAEFKRWFHLVRTEMVEEANKYNPRVAASLYLNMNKKNYIMPLPLEEIEICGFWQNER